MGGGWPYWHRIDARAFVGSLCPSHKRVTPQTLVSEGYETDPHYEVSYLGTWVGLGKIGLFRRGNLPIWKGIAPLPHLPGCQGYKGKGGRLKADEVSAWSIG